jgi:ankyrin repeat protein
MPSVVEASELNDFILAARYGEAEDIREYLNEKFPDANVKPSSDLQDLLISVNEQGQTALHMVAANGHKDCLEIFLPYLSTAQVNIKNQEGSTPLHWAALNGRLECVKLLLNSGADATLLNESGRSSVTLAEQQGHLEVVQELLKSYDPEDEDEDEESKPDNGSASQEPDVNKDQDEITFTLDEHGNMVEKKKSP